MTRDEKIKEVMELVEKYGGHRQDFGFGGWHSDWASVEEKKRAIESKLRELIQ